MPDQLPARWNHDIHHHRLVLDAVPSGARAALDVGRGNGLLAAELHEIVPDVTGLDSDAAALDSARGEDAGVNRVHGDLMIRPFHSAQTVWPPSHTYSEVRRAAGRTLPEARWSISCRTAESPDIERQTHLMPSPSVELRPLQMSDASVLVGWEADPVLCAHAGWTPDRPYPVALAWWREQIGSPDPLLIRLLAVVDGSPVGYADLYGDEPEARELGYLVAPSWRWGQGFGTAIARAGLDHGFRVLGLSRVWAEAVEANEASVRVLRRLGMRSIGDGSAEAFLGVPSRYKRFELLREGWEDTASREQG